MKTKLLITGLAFMALTTLARAQNQETIQKQPNTTGMAWVDANNDGICDNFEARKSSGFRGNRMRYQRGACQCQRQGIGQRVMRQGRCCNQNFADANKNGICDFRETPAKK